MKMEAAQLRPFGWASVVLIALGQLLSWRFARPITEVWDWLFSSVSRPNLEWWIWFLAPVIAGAIAARDLLRGQQISRRVLLPIALFFVVWAALFPTGVRHYLFFRIQFPGFVVTFAALILLGVVSLLSTQRLPLSTRAARGLR